jgi:hypothetical protein
MGGRSKAGIDARRQSKIMGKGYVDVEKKVGNIILCR